MRLRADGGIARDRASYGAQTMGERMFYTLPGRKCAVLPNRCAIVKGGRQCPNPPQYAVSVVSGPDEYMVGVACEVHRQAVSERILHLQEGGHVPSGSVRFAPLRPVGTDCIRADPDDLVSIRPSAERGD